MSNKGIGEMEATTISHLVGQMEAILEILEFRIEQMNMKDYQTESLMEQVYKARSVNNKIFNMYIKDRLDRIKKTYNNGSDENK